MPSQGRACPGGDGLLATLSNILGIRASFIAKVLHPPTLPTISVSFDTFCASAWQDDGEREIASFHFQFHFCNLIETGLNLSMADPATDFPWPSTTFTFNAGVLRGE